MDKIQKLISVLERLNNGEPSEAVRKEAMELVQSVNPLELSLAEQKLIENGLHPEDLRNLCNVHMEVLKDELSGLKSQVEKGHVLDTFILEHDEILKLLTKIDEINSRIQRLEKFDENNSDFKALLETAELIIAAENHHQREERVLFPEMEKRNVTGPTRIMRMEHEDLRAKKRKIRDLALKVSEMDFAEFKKEVDSSVKYVVFNLRDHIFKENHILYPTAINIIKDNNVWDKMKEECDKIGYCPFTPGV